MIMYLETEINNYVRNYFQRNVAGTVTLLFNVRMQLNTEISNYLSTFKEIIPSSATLTFRDN